MSEIKRRGLMLVLSSPSGAGKTTLSRLLLESDKDITLSVSATTHGSQDKKHSNRGDSCGPGCQCGRCILGCDSTQCKNRRGGRGGTR